MTGTPPAAGVDRADTDRWSYYLDHDYYRDLVETARSWSDDWPTADALVRSECEAVLAREARLIDEARFNEWLELFTDRCLYWVPITPGGGDPRTEVSYSFDDRRRMADRVYWLRTGLAFCQIPQSRTRTADHQRGGARRADRRPAPGPVQLRRPRVPRGGRRAATPAGTATSWSATAASGGSRSSR